MKKILSMLIMLVLLTVSVTSCSAQPNEAEPIEIKLKIDNPVMQINGIEKEIDTGRGTTPVIQNERTYIPIRAVVEAMGGVVEWEEETQTTVLAKDDTVILLAIGNNMAFVNENKHILDTEPKIIGERTMLPIRFIAENFGFKVDWDNNTQMIIITK